MTSGQAHLPIEVFQKVLFLPDDKEDTGPAKAHIDKCETCSQVRTLIKLLAERAGNVKPTTLPALSGQSLSDFIIQIYDDSLSPRQAASYLKELKSSPQLFKEFFTALEEAFLPVEEEAELPRYDNLSIAGAVLERIPPETKKNPDDQTVLSDFSLPRVAPPPSAALWHRIFQHAQGRALAWAAAVLFTIGGTFSGYRYYATTYRLNLAEETLAKNERIFYEYPKLSGEYRSSGIGQLMAGDEKPKQLTPREQARQLALKAIESGSRSYKAKQLLAHISLFDRKYLRADSILGTIAGEDADRPEIQNDLGVASLWLDKPEKAVEHFHAALAVDSDFIVAHFNLALAFERMKRKEEGLQQIDIYLESEKDDIARRAALAARTRLEQIE